MANKAAWLVGKQSKPLKVGDAPMPQVGPNDIIVRNHAVAINPVDWAKQNFGIMLQDYPAILGEDAAGEVYAVGSGVENFKKGDRVVYLAGNKEGHKGGPLQSPNSTTTFQLFTKTKGPLIAKIPDKVSYAEACVLPLALCTAAVSLFQHDTLNLPFPQTEPKSTGKVLLVWGGSSSVGSCGIQMAKAAGFKVAATAGPQNVEYLKSLGAEYVFDSRKSGVVDKIVATLKGEELAGAFDAISTFPDATKSCAEVVSKLSGNKFVATVLPPGGLNNLALPEGLPDNVKFSFTYATTMQDNELGPAVWRDWLPAALANGSMKGKPDPLIVGQGLEKIQDAIDRWRQGVSAQKVVVELP